MTNTLSKLLFLLGLFTIWTAHGQSTALTYQGRLVDAGTPVEGELDKEAP